MSEKSKEELTRREATQKILSVIALATGLSISEVRSLLAEDKTATAIEPVKPLNRTEVIKQKATSDKVKALKVLLENRVEVFESEYGRTTPIQKVKIDTLYPADKIVPPDLAGSIVNMCAVHFNPAFSHI